MYSEPSANVIVQPRPPVITLASSTVSKSCSKRTSSLSSTITHLDVRLRPLITLLPTSAQTKSNGTRYSPSSKCSSLSARLCLAGLHSCRTKVPISSCPITLSREGRKARRHKGHRAVAPWLHNLCTQHAQKECVQSGKRWGSATTSKHTAHSISHS